MHRKLFNCVNIKLFKQNTLYEEIVLYALDTKDGP